MSSEQLQKELEDIKHPLLVLRQGDAMQRVFDLYRNIAGREPRGSGRCVACAMDAFYELQRISQVGQGWDNSVNLPPTIKQLNLANIQKMEKYKMTVPHFRAFGSPDTITEANTTDAQVETLLKENPEFSKFFILRDPSKANAKAAIEIEKIVDEKPKKDIPAKPAKETKAAKKSGK